jgi:hypothetical protein
MVACGARWKETVESVLGIGMSGGKEGDRDRRWWEM